MELLSTTLEQIEASKEILQNIFDERNRHAPFLNEKINRRMQSLAEAMIANKKLPDTAKLDDEITAVQNAIAEDLEQAEIAAVAIGLLDSKKAKILYDQTLQLDNDRNNLIAVLNAEFEQKYAEAENLKLKIYSELATIPKRPTTSGLTVIQNNLPDATVASINRERPSVIDANLMASLKSALLHAGAIARVDYDHLGGHKKLGLISAFLNELKNTFVAATRDQNLSIQPWAFSGELSFDEFTEPVIKRLCEVGFDIKNPPAENHAQVGMVAQIKNW